jgi:hypothetical protein
MLSRTELQNLYFMIVLIVMAQRLVNMRNALYQMVLRLHQCSALH